MPRIGKQESVKIEMMTKFVAERIQKLTEPQRAQFLASGCALRNGKGLTRCIESVD